MKIAAATTAAVALLAASSAHAGQNGTIDYTWEFSSPSAMLGETVGVTLWVGLAPGEMPFHALASSGFDIMIDDIVDGGTVSNNTLHPAFDVGPMGNPGVINENDILLINGEQFPAVETASHLAFFTFDYTIDDATPRTVDFDVTNESNLVFTGPGLFDPFVPFAPSFSTGQLEVTGVPAPGALALLGVAGVLTGRGRRRKTLA